MSLLRRAISFADAGAWPFVVLVVGIAGYAWAQVVLMAFSHLRIQAGRFVWSAAWFDNFHAIAANPIALQSVAVTVLFVVTTVAGSVLLGLALALLAHRSRRLRGLAQTVMLWPAVVAPVVVSLIWLLILSPNIGALNKALESLGLPTQEWLGTEIGAICAIILVDIWHWTPVAFLLIYTALCGIDEEAVEAARCDGASEWQVVAYIKLPMLMPALLGTVFIRAVMGAKAFDEMYLLTGGGPNNATTLVSLHIRDVFFDQLNYGYGAAFSLLTVLILSLGVLLVVGGRALHRRRTRFAYTRASPA